MSSTNISASKRLPSRRPQWSAKPTTTVSISPVLASAPSSSAVSSPAVAFLLFVIALPVEDKHLANRLDRFCLRAFAQGSHRLLAIGALDRRRAHLDELVRLEGEA